MDRREFIRKTVQGAAAIGAATLFNLPAGTLSAAGSTPDLVGVYGSTPDVMFEAGIKALGGMGRFVKPGQTVTVKPNIGWSSGPETAANTNPALVSKIVDYCRQAGAKRVYVFDNSCTWWETAYSRSGIATAARNAGATVAPAHSERYYQQVTVPGAQRLTRTAVHELYLSSDVVINVPVLKTHWGATMTGAMKNLMGVVWDRRYYHSNDLQRCIAEFLLYKKPTLNIIDAWQVMWRNGPRGGSPADLVMKKLLILSTDPVAADTAAAKVLNINASSVGHIALGKTLGIGEDNLTRLNIRRIVL